MESLVTISEIRQILKVGNGKIYPLLIDLKIDGLQEVKVKGCVRPRRFLRSSLDAIMVRAAKTDRPIGETKQRRRKKTILSQPPETKEI